jgi:tetratricopeptide (TPR) repeat protein
MKTHRLQWFFHTPDHAVLRRYTEEALVDEANLTPAEVAQWIDATEQRYEAGTEDPLRLAAFGKALYSWLDDPAQRRLAQMREVSSQGWALHIDTEERLRHLPWELLHDGTAFLCMNPTRPFTPVRRVDKFRNEEAQPANRPLRVLFIASSPVDIQPELAFEKEEAEILQSTRHQPIELVVEESGSLAGLAERIESHDSGYFDVLHFTGHADVVNGQPLFCLENDVGKLELADADQIAAAIKGRWPRLLFLSGCSTGKAPQAGLLPSLAEALVRAGAPAVLGWALPVYDATGIQAATGLYHELATGGRIDATVARTRAQLLADGLPDWHLLRLYGNATALDSLVTPLRTAGREKIKLRPAQGVFLDAGGKTEICPHERFVGRRRLLQQALRVLRSFPGEEDYHAGLLLYGMGGQGKSSLAARLCERMTAHERIVLVGRVDEAKLLGTLNAALADVQAAALLNENLPLAARLRRLFDYLVTPVLLVFDDFEHNLDPLTNVVRLAPEAAGVIHAVLAAVHESATESRVIVTCRYRFPLTGPAHLFPLDLPSMRSADLAKKTAQLPAWYRDSGIAAELLAQAEQLADGNPRLLERFDRLLLARRGGEAEIFWELAENAADFREEILLRALFEPLPDAAQHLLACAALIHLPVAWEIVTSACGAPPETRHQQALVDLGLLEETPHEGDEPQYYVSALLHAVVADVLPPGEIRAAQGRAALALHQTEWEAQQGIAEERALEILRLALAGGETAIAGKLADVITGHWLNNHRYREAVALCEQVIPTAGHPGLLHNLARAEEVLGRVAEARRHYQATRNALQAMQRDDAQQQKYAANLHNFASLEQQQGKIEEALGLWQESLSIEESIGNVRGKAATLHQMAGVLAQQGKIEEALGMWRESLSIEESIGNVRGKAATLHNMAWALAQQGKIEEALGLWRESLTIHESIGDVHGKAATLHEMAVIQYQAGETGAARETMRLAVDSLAAIGAWPDLARVLGNFSQLDEPHAPALLAQGYWLVRRVDTPLDDLVNLTFGLFKTVGPQAACAPWLALALGWRVRERHAGHPDARNILDKAMPAMLTACAAARGIENQEQFDAWMQTLAEPGREALERQLDAELVTLADGRWLFDHRRYKAGVSLRTPATQVK